MRTLANEPDGTVIIGVSHTEFVQALVNLAAAHGLMPDTASVTVSYARVKGDDATPHRVIVTPTAVRPNG